MQVADVFISLRGDVPPCSQSVTQWTQAAREAGYKSGDSVSQLVERFNQHGLAALLIAPGQGRKETYTPLERERIMQEFRRAPDRQDDATATWPLMTLRRHCARKPSPGRSKYHPLGSRARTTSASLLARIASSRVDSSPWAHYAG